VDRRIFQYLPEQSRFLDPEHLNQVMETLPVERIDQAQHLVRLIAYLDNRVLLEDLDQAVQPPGDLI